MMKRVGLITALLMALLIGAVYYNTDPTPVEADATGANPDEVVTKLDKDKLAKDDIHLDVPKVKAKISPRDVEAIARQEFAGIVENSKDVKVEYHLITNKSFQLFSQAALDKNLDLKTKKHMDKMPAYIVSFQGASYQTHTPAGFQGPAPVQSEINVVIDAMSGEVLMAFSNR
jgi:hypothetical protein